MRGMRAMAALPVALALAACGGGPRMQGGAELGESTALECAPYARQVSGLALQGEADAWWEAAAGRYARSTRPAPGSVLVFRRSARLPHGHVSVVTRVLAPDRVLVTQANWVHRRIGRDDLVQDASPGNDWSAVRVWWAPAGQLGTGVYPTYGFILPDGAAMAGTP